ncbi:MAG: hypothetical protein JKY03_11650 [Aureispira sp.]|nr:hypothetical protein [Aureispira sp.]
MTLKTFLTLSVAMFLLISCNEETVNKETITTTTTTATTTKEEIPSPPSIKDKVKTADAMMVEIEAAKKEQKVEKKRYMSKTEAHDQSIYVVYSKNEEMVKLTENIGESMYSSDAVYYYQNGTIFLIHTINSFDDNRYNETKVYFENGNPIAAMGKSIEEEDRDTDLASLQMEKQKLSKAIYNMEQYMKNLSKIPARLAASTLE